MSKAKPSAPVAQPAAEKPSRAATAVERDEVQFPCAMYRKVKVSKKHPDGVETKRVEDASLRASLGKEWKDSPEGMFSAPDPVED